MVKVLNHFLHVKVLNGYFFQVIELPVRTNQIPRQIPEQVEYCTTLINRNSVLGVFP
jgi:hypothetical protein